MFIVVPLKDVAQIPPDCLLAQASPTTARLAAENGPSAAAPAGVLNGHELLIVVRHCLCSKYVGRIVSRQGYCVTIAAVDKVSDPAVLHNGEGSVWCSVEFRAILFRPLIDERIRATIAVQSVEGLRLSIVFFQEILVPAESLVAGSAFDEARGSWYVEIEPAEDEGLGSQPPVPHRNYYHTGDQVIVSIAAVHVGTDAGASAFSASAATSSSGLDPSEPIMFVLGSFLGIGLGPTCWYT